jgi:hypothetical protein
MKKEYLLSRGEETHIKKGTEWLRLRNHIIIVDIFSSVNFKKRLSRRDTDKSFHLSTTQDKVKNSIKVS